MAADDRQVVVVGGGISRFAAERVDGTPRDWAVEAVLAALEDGGVDRDNLEHTTVSYFSDYFNKQTMMGAIFHDCVGMCPKPLVRVEGGGGSGGLALRNAYAYVKAGLCDSMLVIGAENMGRHVPSEVAQQFIALASDTDWEYPVGGFFIAYYAVMMREHMKLYGTTEEQMARVSVKNHRNAYYNPLAHRHVLITVDDVLNSPVIASPYKRLDCSQLSDGAAALIVATEDWARRHSRYWEQKATVYFSGTGCGTDFMRPGDRPRPYPGLSHFRATNTAARQAYAMAGITNPRKDIDVAELHDAYSGVEIQTCENLMFCGDGEAAHLLETGVFDVGGELAVNTSGGLIGFGHPVGATGISQAVEILRQLRGEAEPERQAPGARRGLTESHGGTCTITAINIFEIRD